MTYNIFADCFEYLCFTFDLPFEDKKKSMDAYYKSPLGKLTEHQLRLLIEKSAVYLEVKSGKLPSIRNMLNLMPQVNAASYKRPTEESFYAAECPKCGHSGYVPLTKQSKDGHHIYEYIACCTCEMGRIKMETTKIGREVGSYLEYLEHGYEVLVL